MSARRIHRLLATLAASAIALVGAPLAASPASAAGTLATTICYDVSQAGSFTSTAHSAASIWNNYTNNINMSNCGTNLRIYQIYGGGSYAVRTSLGNGRVYIDTYQAQQYSPLRIMTHEIGHILGLPDNYNGQCSLLMSGGSAGTSCTNPYPAATEAARVDQLFGGLTRTATPSGVFQGSWPAPVPVS
ncbi:snapalysin family zinc-dependent metalloprotease [Micromonospora echinofusca]|uniref:Extracellular small neutral protease n=1 Tax=Micromonospora echinofusca TaxID=47858 RepID=A0ABS3VYX0_MICEH|nr:snapalysin family zinc-dependent metalloprotease [Micromonospora echinofusca]MBO4209538.1 snapalysin family zinc-dependent metalloprotease [Micromonospora echinofusca]